MSIGNALDEKAFSSSLSHPLSFHPFPYFSPLSLTWHCLTGYIAWVLKAPDSLASFYRLLESQVCTTISSYIQKALQVSLLIWDWSLFYLSRIESNLQEIREKFNFHIIPEQFVLVSVLTGPAWWWWYGSSSSSPLHPGLWPLFCLKSEILFF